MIAFIPLPSVLPLPIATDKLIFSRAKKKPLTRILHGPSVSVSLALCLSLSLSLSLSLHLFVSLSSSLHLPSAFFQKHTGNVTASAVEGLA